ncbi:MAG TPA: TonB-dependent receptor, partial [Burkholderiaceae bacterium]|nr:TonB-dependent receptor [Burkholderiaceae bacterium]
PSAKYEYGVSLGAPIKQDQVHYFFAYDGKDINDSRSVIARNLDQLPAGQGVVPSIAAAQGSTVDRFREHLLFGKVDAQLNDEQKLSASMRLRRESDRVPEDRNLSAPGNDKDRSNDETHFDLKHEWGRPSWLSEARVGYEDSVWNPHSASSTPFIRYKFSPGTPQLLTNSQDVLFVGGSPDAQRREQKGPYVSEDFTFTALAQHVLKGGVKFKAARYDLSGSAFSVDTINTLVDRTNGQVFYGATGCTGTNIINGGNNSDQCEIRRATPASRAAFSNNQIGLYIQDDWAITRRLELNLGVRYDYETNMLNNDYVTPADRVAAIFGLDTRTFTGQSASPGQTYAQSLAKGGINISEYIADGHSRKSFTAAIAPRLGASFDVLGDRNTVLFGGYGRSYDRTMANHALDELQRNATPGQGEIWLVKNDFKMPYADQYSLGLRQAVGAWNTEVALSQIYAKNQFVWFIGNRDLNGGTFFQSPIDPLFGGPPGYGNLLLGDFVGKTRTRALFVKGEKPYTVASAWGVNIAYTLSDAKTTHREWNNDIFDFTYGKPGQGGWKPSTLVDKHRLVGAAVIDLPWGLTLAGKATWASGIPRRVITCPGGFPDPNAGREGTCVTAEGDSPSFRQVDMSLSKELALGATRFTLRADVFNIFNTINYGGFDDFAGAPPPPGNPTNSFGGDNLNLNKPNSIRGDPRTVRIALGVRW